LGDSRDRFVSGGVIALVAGVLTLLLAEHVEQPGRHWYRVPVLLPAVGSVLVSGNLHQESELASWPLEFLQLFSIA
jgi:hypothetical protein